MSNALAVEKKGVWTHACLYSLKCIVTDLSLVGLTLFPAAQGPGHGEAQPAPPRVPPDDLLTLTRLILVC